MVLNLPQAEYSAPGDLIVDILPEDRLEVVADDLTLDEEDHVLGDIGGQVAHPLEVVVHLQGGDDEAKIGRNRLVQRAVYRMVTAWVR